METKICGRCKEWKPVIEFYRSTRDRYRSQCKGCGREYKKEYYSRPSAINHVKEYYSRPDVIERTREYSKEYKREYRKRPGNYVKVTARRYLNAAVKSGIITREPCVMCGEPRGQGHHPSYDKPLMVVWLCLKCHSLLHLKAGQVSLERMTA